MFKRTIIILILFLCSCNYKIVSLYAENAIISIPKDKSIYLVVIGGSREGQLGGKVPFSKICKVDFGNNNTTLKSVILFDSLEEFDSKLYNDYRFLTIGTSNGQDGFIYDLNVILMDKPWRKIHYELNMLGDLYPLKYQGKIYLLYYFYDEEQNRTIIKRLNINLPGEAILPKSIMNGRLMQGDVIYIENNRLTLKGWGLDKQEIPLPPPLEELRDNLDKLELIYDSDEYSILKSYYFPDKQKGKDNYIFIYNKTKLKWDKLGIEGDETYVDVMNHIILCRIGYQPISGRNDPTEYTGEWVLIDPETGIKQSLKLNSLSRIVFASDQYLLAIHNKTLLYIPILNGKIMLEKGIILYKERKEDIGTSNEIVSYIQGAFIGPKKLPGEK